MHPDCKHDAPLGADANALLVCKQCGAVRQDPSSPWTAISPEERASFEVIQKMIGLAIGPPGLALMIGMHQLTGVSFEQRGDQVLIYQIDMAVNKRLVDQRAPSPPPKAEAEGIEPPAAGAGGPPSHFH